MAMTSGCWESTLWYMVMLGLRSMSSAWSSAREGLRSWSSDWRKVRGGKVESLCLTGVTSGEVSFSSTDTE